MRMEYNPFLGMGLVLLIILVAGDLFGNLIYTIAQAVAGI